MELLFYLPRDYLDYSVVTPVALLKDGAMAATHVRIQSEPRIFHASGMTVITVQASDETGAVALKWFGQPYRCTQVHTGMMVYACGRISMKKGCALINPTLNAKLPGTLPIYPTVKGLSQRTIRDAVFSALRSCWNEIQETLPLTILANYELCTLQLALRHVHFPSSPELLKIARRRMTFENMLCYLLTVEIEKQERQRLIGISFETLDLKERFLQKLPFAPTQAQLRVLCDLEQDMSSAVPMNRLVQGDVGSGKTVIALYALTVAAANGYQGAMLAPTEILAQQHFDLVRTFFGDTAVLLTGSMKKAVREAALNRIADGTAICVVGTHALFQQEVRFQRLGVVVTDEQHRFGVRQRATMQEKGIRPDVLVMSATPIPRTLALLLYGDLDVSIIDELPPGRKPVKTHIIPTEKRTDMYRYIAEAAKNGLQTYIVCPFIEDSELLNAPSVESVFQFMKMQFPKIRIAALHGRMTELEKQRIVHSFRDGDIDVLVTTTVIEVGVHVENACIMAVEGADRFGLSQLHQLRGRVGRSTKQAYCFLLNSSETETAEKRIDILAKTNDGFEIARQDLALRGPGDFLGLRQHGEGDASLIRNALDMELIEQVKLAVRDVLDLPNTENQTLIEYALRRYDNALSGIAMN